MPLKKRVLLPTPLQIEREEINSTTPKFDKVVGQSPSSLLRANNYEGTQTQRLDSSTTHERSEQFDVDIAMKQAYQKSKDKITSEYIRPIGNDIFAYYNSLNILVGNQGKGKSHIVIRDLIQISRLSNTNIHLIVYISKSGTINDSTLESQQDLIKLPIQVIADVDAEKYLKKLDLYKDLYTKYCRGVDIPDDVMNDMFEFLHLSNNNRFTAPLSTIIVCEDFVKSNLIKSSYFTNFITQLRHKHAIVYINVQFFKSIPTDYKNNATSFLIFNGFSRQKLGYIYQQVPMPIEFEELYYEYKQLKNHDVVYVNTRENYICFRMFD